MIERSVTKRYPFEMIFENTILTIDYMIPLQIVQRLSVMSLLSSFFFLFSFLFLFINSVPYEKRYVENIFLKFGRIESHETIRQTNTIGGGWWEGGGGDEENLSRKGIERKKYENRREVDVAIFHARSICLLETALTSPVAFLSINHEHPLLKEPLKIDRMQCKGKEHLGFLIKRSK